MLISPLLLGVTALFLMDNRFIRNGLCHDDISRKIAQKNVSASTEDINLIVRCFEL